MLVYTWRHAHPANEYYVADLESKGMTAYAIVEEMERAGRLDNVLVIDVQNDFNPPILYYSLAVLLSLAFYFFITHVVYCIIAYVIVGSAPQ